jgi:hypothetical protein
MKLIAGATVGAALYVSAYLLLSTPDTFRFCSLGYAGTPYSRVAEFRVGGETAKQLFAPLTWIDQAIRPNYWAGTELFDGTSVPSGDPRASGIVPGGGFSGSMPSESSR